MNGNERQKRNVELSIATCKLTEPGRLEKYLLGGNQEANYAGLAQSSSSPAGRTCVAGNAHAVRSLLIWEYRKR